MKVNQGFQQAPEQVAAVLAQISPDDLRKIIDYDEVSYWFAEREGAGRYQVAGLVRLKLLEEVPREEWDSPPPGKTFGYAVRVTPLGKQVRQFLANFLARLAEGTNNSDKSDVSNLSGTALR
ncbi:MAG: hypothetical protein ACJ75H_00380 [Thermoanaerobaculia bacterium]